ncbi:MAG: PAS domain S-box protein [Spirochaetes bacterium]|nr:PAS domain S-box protein [Spirochaetota bacterium]
MKNTNGYKKPVSWRVYFLMLVFIFMWIFFYFYYLYNYHSSVIEFVFFMSYLLINIYIIILFRKNNRARLNDIDALENITRFLADEINEKNRIQDELTKSELRYRSIFENTDNAIAVYEAVNNGEDFIFRQFNKSGEKIEKLSRDEVIGRSVTEVFPGVEKFGLLEVFKRVWETGETEQFPLKLYKDNRLRGWRNNYIYKLPCGDIVAVYSDETGRMLAQEERENLIKELEDKNRELENFSYMVSHDLKSPLITIKGFTDLLEKDILNNDTGSIKSDVEKIKNAADKMEVQLNEMLELSRIGRLINPPAKISFKKLVEEAIDSAAGQLARINPDIIISENLPDVYVDGMRIREMLMNLIDNAAKFIDKENPVIEIGTLENTEEAVFYVRDNGPGIHPSYHEKIFGLFDKLDPGTAGSGAGLAIVKRIVEVHGGRVWVESDGTGNGSVFYFTLPVHEPEAGKQH